MPATGTIVCAFRPLVCAYKSTAGTSTALPVTMNYLCAAAYRPALLLPYAAAYNPFDVTALTAALTANFAITATLVMHIQFDLLSFSLSKSIYAAPAQSVALFAEV